MISIANEKQNITKQPKKLKNQKGILNVQPNKFVFREEKQTCSNENLCSVWLKPIKPIQIYQWLEVSEVGCSERGGGGFLSICLIFQVTAPPLESATPQALDQSCEHQVSPHNLSLKAIIIIIIGSFRPSHGGKI